MPNSIENYIPQVAVEKSRRRAFKVWGIFAFIAAFWVFLILLTPLAKTYNLNNVSNSLYNFFSYICHQIDSRAFHIENHAFPVCSRCFGVYFGLLAGFIVYPFLRPVERTEAFPRFWLFLAMIPMAIDWSLGISGIWENTHFSRFLTGLILGSACAIFIVPALIDIFELLAMKTQIRKPSQ
jgi:uncharacterized membrane protein